FGCEVDEALQHLGRTVVQVAQTGWDRLEVPDVGHLRSKRHVAHAFTTNVGRGDLHATTSQDAAVVPHPPLVAGHTLRVTGGAGVTLTENVVLFWLQGAVVDGLRLLYLALRPTADVVGGGQSNTKLVEEIYVEHVTSPFHPPETEEVDWLLVLNNVSC